MSGRPASAARPYTAKKEQARIDAALAATGGRVTRVETPFPGSFLYVPTDAKPVPGLVNLHGSEGGARGIADEEAVRWAHQGFAVMAYSYFGVDGAPQKLVEVNLDQTLDALKWLKASPYVRGNKVGLTGFSRGAEQALFLAAQLKAPGVIDAVGALSPHATIVGSFDPDTQNTIRDAAGAIKPAWTFKGKPVNHHAPIAIENYAGPAYIAQGTKDAVWPGAAKALEQRIRAAGDASDIDVTFDYVPNAGHALEGAQARQFEDDLLAFFHEKLDGAPASWSESRR